MDINRYRNLIANIPVMDHTSVSKRENWDHEECRGYCKELIDFADCDGLTISISRKELLLLARGGTTRRFLFATYLWGYPSGNRGRYRQVFHGADTILERLEGLPRKIGEGNWLSEYGRLQNGTEGMGISTWTKLLYFLRIEIAKRPALILDGQIISTFGRRVFDGFETLAMMTYENAPRHYPNYLKKMHEVAKELKVDADQLEMFLYIFGNSLK